LLPGPVPVGVSYGDGNKRTYANEITVGWEKRLPHASSFSATFLVRNDRDAQSSDDVNMFRDPVTGKFLGRVWPDYDAISRTYAPNRIWTNFTALQLLYVRQFSGRWGVNANYWYQINNRIYRQFNPTTENYQYMINPATHLPFKEGDFSNKWGILPRHNARASGFVRLPFGLMVSTVYDYVQCLKFDVFTGDYPLGSAAPRVVLSNGRSVVDPFFNIAYPRAGRRGADMIASDDSHVVNLRVEKTVQLRNGRHIQFSADAFNAFNNGAARSFMGASSWAVDERRADFGVKTNTVPARVGQLGIRFVF
jgi:hypothetical protein